MVWNGRLLSMVGCVVLASHAVAGETERASQTIAESGVHGGLVVHVGCGEGTWTAGLHAGDAYLVHGLDIDVTKVETARKQIESLGLYGPVSADTFDGIHLPYADNTVNLLIVEPNGQVPESELQRVLAPNGVAYRKTPGGWTKTVKPRPTGTDEWTHYLHGPDNNAVADDTVAGPPRRLQWQGGPKWTRHHDHMSSLSALVSSGGRLFYILDEGSSASIFLPSRWSLIARDAFNGKILWKRRIDNWYTRFKGLKDGPADAPRRLVAEGNRIFATLSLAGPVMALDAVTGETVRTYAGTEGAEEILLSDGVLYALLGPGSIGDGGRLTRPTEKRRIAALRVDSGEKLWDITDVVAATTLAVDRQHVYYFNFDQKTVACLERGTGQQRWTSEPLPSPEKQTSFFASKLVVRSGVVLFASGEFSGMTKSGGGETRPDTLTALSAQTGQRLWSAKHPPSGYSSAENVFVIGDVVWCDDSSNGRSDGRVMGLDLQTGAELHNFTADRKNYWFHHRCYPGKATTNYLMTSRTGIEFIDLRSEHWDLNHWVRGACLYGIMPANGLVYTPPAPCICYAESMLHSFNAFAPAAPLDRAVKPVAREQRLEKGPAYDGAIEAQVSDGDWPTYRGSNSRSGSSRTLVPSSLEVAWKTKLGGRLSSVVVAEGKVFVASIDRHTVYALDGDTGNRLWQFTAGGRVDSPPTFFEGRVLFGSADGYVYCLRSRDGALVWRFLAAPVDRRIVSYEQLESLWPVHGSVLVREGVAHFVAGRSLFIDGGMRMYQLDARTGRLLLEIVLDERDPQGGGTVQDLVKWLNMPVGRPDVLSCDDQRIYMRSQAFDLQGRRLAMGPSTEGPQEGSNQGGERTHLFCPTGFLDDTWFHRTYWLYGKTWGSGWNGYYVNGKYAPGGRILCVGEDYVYGFDRQPQYYRWTAPLEYRLYAARKEWEPTGSGVPDTAKRRGKKAAGTTPSPVDRKQNYRWSTQVPILARAMVLADRTLFIAGPNDVLEESALNKALVTNALVEQQEAALEGRSGGTLLAIGAADGMTLADYDLESPPIFDGMAAADGRLYVAAMNGSVVCLGRVVPKDQ